MEETKTLKKKKPYVKPEMMVEEFTPDQLVCTGCYNYTGVLKCEYGQKGRFDKQGEEVNGSYRTPDGLDHGSPCSEIKVTANGVNITGTEYKKSTIQIYNVNVGSFDWSTAASGITVNGVTWNSVDGSTYSHKGTLEFTSKAEQIAGRLNHS